MSNHFPRRRQFMHLEHAKDYARKEAERTGRAALVWEILGYSEELARLLRIVYPPRQPTYKVTECHGIRVTFEGLIPIYVAEPPETPED